PALAPRVCDVGRSAGTTAILDLETALGHCPGPAKTSPVEQRCKLRPDLFFDRLRRAQDGAGLQEAEGAKNADVGSDDQIRRTVLELLGRNGIAHEHDGGDEAFPWIGNVAPATVSPTGNIH